MYKFLLLAIATGIIIFLLRSRRESGPIIGHSEQRLLKRCYGDKELAERLINRELQRNPKLSRDNAALDALESLLRDNR